MSTNNSLAVQDNSALVLNVTAIAPDMFFVNGAWESGEAVTVKYGGFTYSGTVGDRTFSNDESAAAPGGKTKAIAGARGFGENEGGTLNGNYVNQVSGGYRQASSGEIEWEDVSLTINGGYYNKSVNGVDTLTANGTLTRSDAEIDFTINGGEFNQRVAGGMFYNPASGTAQDGDSVALVNSNIYMNIYGGVFHDRVLGGNNATTDEMGQYTSLECDEINIEVRTNNEIVFDECLVAGSRGGGTVAGNTAIWFYGDGSKLTFAEDSIVWGGCSGDYVKVDDDGSREQISSVTGDRVLAFNQFTGDFDAEALLFTNIIIQGGSNVNFSDENIDLQDIENWRFTTDATADLNSGTNDFTGDTLTIAGLTSGKLVLLTADSEDAFAGFDSFKKVSWFNSGTVTYNEDLGVWTDGTKQLALEENDGKWSMTLSNVA